MHSTNDDDDDDDGGDGDGDGDGDDDGSPAGPALPGCVTAQLTID